MILILHSSDLFSQRKEKNTIIGKYEFFEENLIGFDDCCRLKWNLILNSDSTFRLDFKSDQGDYLDYTYSFGDYRIKNNTLCLFSKAPKEFDILESMEDFPDSLFMISFKNEGWTMGYLYNQLNNRKFYLLDKNYEASSIEPIYTVPNKTKVDSTKGYDNIAVGFKPTDFKLISYVFKRPMIEEYLLCEIKEVNNVIVSSILINLKDFPHNNYLVGHQDNVDRNRYESKEFVDVSAYRFKIKRGQLISTTKFYNGVGKLKYVKLKKTTS
jgi:hypothetical protein